MQFVQSSPVLGTGVGLRKMYDATNVLMSTLAETGIVGLAAFLSIFIAFIPAAWKKRKLVAPDKMIFVNMGIALTASSLVHGCVDHYWNRGLLVVWSAVGMSINAMSRAGRPPTQVAGRTR